MRIATRTVLLVYLIMVMILYYLPLAVAILFSFKAGTALSFPIDALTLKWFQVILSKSAAIDAALRSLQLAVVVGALTMVIVLLTALALRERFRGRDLIFYLLMLGVILPGVLFGLGTTIFYRVIEVELSLWTSVPVLVLYAVPFGLLIMLSTADPELVTYENAARTLGASGWTIFREVTFPLIYTQVVAAALFGFTLSLTELMRTSLTSAGAPSLPLYTFAYITNRALSPDFFALATITIAISIVMIVAVGIFLARGPARRSIF